MPETLAATAEFVHRINPALLASGSGQQSKCASDPNDHRAAVEEKVQDYLSAGVRLIWVVDPKSKTVEEYRPEAPKRIYHSADQLPGHDVFPDLRCSVADFFA